MNVKTHMLKQNASHLSVVESSIFRITMEEVMRINVRHEHASFIEKKVPVLSAMVVNVCGVSMRNAT